MCVTERITVQTMNTTEWLDSFSLGCLGEGTHTNADVYPGCLLEVSEDIWSFFKAWSINTPAPGVNLPADPQPFRALLQNQELRVQTPHRPRPSAGSVEREVASQHPFLCSILICILYDEISEHQHYPLFVPLIILTWIIFLLFFF